MGQQDGRVRRRRMTLKSGWKGVAIGLVGKFKAVVNHRGDADLRDGA